MPSIAPADFLQCRIDDRGEAGRIAYITVNNPAKRNTLGMPGKRAIRLQKPLMRDWERMSITDGIWQGIRACVKARSTDEPRRMMEAFIARKRK